MNTALLKTLQLGATLFDSEVKGLLARSRKEGRVSFLVRYYTKSGIERRPKIGEFDTELFKEFHQAFAMNLGACVHLETLYGDNSHHIAESGFKALARALRTAVELDPKTHGHAPSTKGVL